MDLSATIAAVASATGRAERSIVSAPIRAAGFFATGLPVDCPAILHLWAGSKSYTGQPMAELHVPGSPPLVELVLSKVYALGARPARPGEFTLRAFLAGKVDLAQAEAVLGVIDAFDHEELSTALRQLAGGLSGLILGLRNELAELLADLEAGLDFVEEDIEFISQPEIARRLTTAIETIGGLLSRVDERSQSTGTKRVALAGLPNAGKSTLFNALNPKASAIVSDVAGTTRDYLACRIDCNGMSIELIDTAGWEVDESGIGHVAQRFRSEQVTEADLVVWCSARDLDFRNRRIDDSLRREIGQNRPVLEIQTRADLLGCELPVGRNKPRAVPAVGMSENVNDAGTALGLFRPTPMSVSAVTGEGLDRLVATIAERLGEQRRGSRQFVDSTAARSRDSLVRARDSLDRANESASAGLGDELTSLEIRDALDALGEIVGAVYTDDLLDRVFSRFCIGK